MPTSRSPTISARKTTPAAEALGKTAKSPAPTTQRSTLFTAAPAGLRPESTRGFGTSASRPSDSTRHAPADPRSHSRLRSPPWSRERPPVVAVSCDCWRKASPYACRSVTGATVYYVLESAPDVIAVPVGAFADPAFPEPHVSVWERRKHGWVLPPTRVEHVS